MNRADIEEAAAEAVVGLPASGAPVTEASAPGTDDLDLRSTVELVELMNAEDARVPSVVASAATGIAEAVDEVAARLRGGGRLVYAGAGTSGRLAALDAAEAVSTFSTEPGKVVALLAGGSSAAPEVQDAAEDDAAAGAEAVRALGVGPSDAVIGVSASGSTPYVLGAVGAAAEAGAWTAAIVSADGSELGRVVDCELAVVVGPEVIAGSTRLKAGTAQKLVLNTISTVAMIRLGKTYGPLMVDVAANNEKLRARARRIVSEATGADESEAAAALAAAGGSAKVAIVSLLARVDAETASAMLERADGHIRRAVSQ